MATDIAACQVYHWNLICLTFTISDSSCDWVLGSTSLMPRPTTHKEKGLVTIERFIACTESPVFILDEPMK